MKYAAARTGDAMVSPPLDPEIAARIDALPQGALAGASVVPLEELRNRPWTRPQLSDAIERTDHVVPGSAGQPDILVRVYRPVGVQGPLPAVFGIHGGSYIRGAYDGEDPLFDEWCLSTPCVGLSVAYRLSPETPYPGALEDCYTVLKWAHNQAASLGIDPGRFGIYGGSAGGGLAAALAILARDRTEIPVAFQLLIYPMLDDRQITVSSRWDLVNCTTADAEFGWRSYLGDLFGSTELPPTAAAARAPDVSRLPPAFIAVGTADGFLDEDVEFALRLAHAGVPVELHVYPGASHGFDRMFSDTSIARKARADVVDWLRRVTLVQADYAPVE